MRAIAAAILCVVAIAGCQAPPAPPAPSPNVLRTQTTREYTSSSGSPRQTTSAAATNPTGAIRTFASAYINWSAATVSGDMRALAAESIGQARSAMELAAADTAQDYELKRGGVANSGTVEAIAPLRGSGTRYVVVTLERTTATNSTAYEGLKPAWHLAVASVTQLSASRWVLSGWQPET